MKASVMTIGLSRLLGAGAVVLAGLWSGAANASPNYPAVLQEVAEAPCIPCNTCHVSNPGASGTAFTSGKSFVLAGPVAGLAGGLSDSKVKEVFEKMKAGAIPPGGATLVPLDTDKDMILDFEELKVGSNPSIAGEVDLCPVDYGCARVAPAKAPASGESAFGAAAVALALTLSLRSRRR